MAKKDIIGAVAIVGSIAIALGTICFFVLGGDSQPDEVAVSTAAKDGVPPAVVDHTDSKAAVVKRDPEQPGSVSTTIAPPPPPPPVVANPSPPRDGDNEPPTALVPPITSPAKPPLVGTDDVHVAGTPGTSIPAKTPPVDPAESEHGILERPADEPPDHATVREPDPSVAIRTQRLTALYQQRQTLRTDWATASNLCQQLTQSAALAQQQVQQANLESAKLQVLYLQVESQRQAANKAGATAQAAAYRNQIDQMKIQQAQLQNVHATATQQLPVLTRQLAGAKQELVKKQGECERFCGQWAEHYDPYGHLSRAHHEQTAALCGQWLAEDDAFVEAYILRGFAALHLGQHEAALDDFTTIVSAAQQQRLTASQRPELTRALAGRAMAHAQMGQDEKASADLATAAKLDQKSALVNIFSARVHARFERYRSACEDYARAAKFDETEPAAYREAAWLFATSSVRQVPRAVALAKQACELTGWKDWRCLDTYAVARAADGDFASADAWLKKAAALAPPEAQAGIANHAKLCQGEVVPTDPL